MVSQRTEPQKRKRPRSPAYPGIDLSEAIERARVIHQKEGRNAAPVNTILAHWGYKPMSGPGLTALSALKKFGVLIDEGSGPNRKARLSEAALAILLDEREESPARLQLIQQAALLPPIHQELWQKYGTSLPSDETLKFELRHDRSFTDAGVGEFIPQYKRTLAFAKLGERAPLSVEVEDRAEAQVLTPTVTTTPPKPLSGAPEARSVQLPISATEWAILQAPFPLSEAGWKQMLAVLNAMKPALVSPKEGEEQPRPGEGAARTSPGGARGSSAPGLS